MEYLSQFFSNRIIGVGALSWAAAQIIKIILDFLANKKINFTRLLSSGGMPSSHSSFVTSVSMYMGFTEGFDSPIFALCFAFSMVVMYDAAGVRRAAGKQAEILNLFIENAESIGLKIDKKLKELLGHSPIEVFAGAILGIIVAAIFYKFR